MPASDRVGAGAGGHGPRPWTLEEANAALPRLRELLPELRSWEARLRRIRADRHRLSDFWGKEFGAPDMPDRSLRVRLEEESADLTTRLELAIDGLKREGIEVRDLDSGLVDFRSVRDGEPIYLCWHRGEAAVAFFHALDGGFRTRRPCAAPTPPSPPTAPE